MERPVNARNYLVLHMIILLYSLSQIFSKLAAGEAFLSFRFLGFYGVTLFLLFMYALAWQQIIREMPLTTAFANKAVTTFWGLIFGALFFREQITWNKLLGVALIIAGIILCSYAEQET